MKPLLRRVLACGLVLAALAAPRIAAQEPRLSAPGTFGPPEPLWPKTDGAPVSPFSRTIDADFYPIGWSPSGKFAYLTRLADEAVGDGPQFSLVIMDLVEDHTLFFSISDAQKDPLPEYLATPEYREKPLEIFWKHHEAEFLPLLEKQKIRWTLPAFRTFPMAWKGDTITGILTTEMDYVEDFAGEFVKRHQIFLKKAKAGTIKRAADHRSTAPYELILDLKLLGFVPSPYEDRLALVVGVLKQGWEGPPHVRDFFLVGSHLNVGFVRPEQLAP